MENGNDILEKIGKPSCNAPEGYFESLKGRLEAIPSQSAQKPGTWVRFRPYLALAASFAAIVVAFSAILRNTAMPGGLTESDNSLSGYAEMISLASPESLYLDLYGDEEYPVQEGISEEDIINYLIETGVSENHLIYAAYNLK